MTKRLLTTEQLTQCFHVSRRTVYRWNEEGLKFTREGRRCYYDLKDVREFIESRESVNRNTITKLSELTAVFYTLTEEHQTEVLDGFRDLINTAVEDEEAQE